MSVSALIEIIKKNGGTIRMSDVLNAGVNRYTLYSMLKKGELERISRGIYRLSDAPTMSEPDLSIVASRIPNAVICLISALSFYDMTTQIPHRISIALPTGVKAPKLDYPPITTYNFSRESFEVGIENHRVDGIPLRVYNPEKTLVDCFKFRNKIGMDVVLEALKSYNEKQAIDVKKLMKYAKICRVSNVIKPYLEASL